MFKNIQRIMSAASSLSSAGLQCVNIDRLQVRENRGGRDVEKRAAKAVFAQRFGHCDLRPHSYFRDEVTAKAVIDLCA